MDKPGSQAIETILSVGTCFLAHDTLWNLRTGHKYIVTNVKVVHALPDKRSADDHITFDMTDEASGKPSRLEGLRDELHVLLLHSRIKLLSNEQDDPFEEKSDTLEQRVLKFVQEHPGQPMHVIQKELGLPITWVGPGHKVGTNGNLSATLSHMIKRRVLWSIKKPGASVDGSRAAGVFYATSTHSPARRLVGSKTVSERDFPHERFCTDSLGYRENCVVVRVGSS